MRNLRNYSTREWFRIKPLDHFMIQVCNDILQSTFCTIRPKSLKRFLHNAEHIARGRDVWLVVAYEDPWTLDWLLRMAARHLTDGTVLVFDNSRRAQARDDIERTCQDRGVPYLALPPNPTAHPNRSHGMAMTWVFRNVVQAVRPRTFSFIDHDLIPMEKIGRGAILEDQPFYGALNIGKFGGTLGWNLCAGYCSYDFSAVHHLPLNFLNDFSRDLDTGGRNWPILYKKFDHTQVRFAPRLLREVIDPLHKIPHTIPVVDNSWIHLCGAGYSKTYRDKFDFYKRIARATDENATVL
ncbi:MAG: hypothetical protein JXB09_04980 [Deltaproteobacteria bacterium]|nr:hypothetical protein [Deltaproteobacteria bacterium]